jgi:YD repeat-containing protein
MTSPAKTGADFSLTMSHETTLGWLRLAVYLPKEEVWNKVTAVLTAHTGDRRVFEVIRTQPAGVPLLYGRLIRIEDRNQNAVVVSYVYGAQASSAELRFDSTRSRLWQIQTVTDAYGVSARFHYADVLVGDRWAVDRIALPNGGQLQYLYRQELPQQVTEGPFLREVIHPDDTQSRFTLRFDPELQLVVMGFDDSAAGPSQARKEVFVTPSEALLNGNIVKQTPNLVRRVVNGDGELVYRNWEDPTDSHITYFYEGGVLHRLTAREDGFPVAYARAVSYCVGQDPRSATFETIETYDANLRQMLTARQDALGRVQQFMRDDGSRAVVGLKLPDGSTVQATYNAFRKPLQVTDRLGRIVEKTYDARGNILTSTVAKGSSAEATSRLGYSSRGQVTQLTDANGNTTEYIYDATGRLVAQIEPADSPREPQAKTTFALRPRRSPRVAERCGRAHDPLRL